MLSHSVASAGYLRHIAYPEHVHRELMPTWLASTVQAVGQRPPDITQAYTYLDLGCGTGLNTIVAASCNPLGHFIGVDFNPEQIHAAKALASSLGVHNIEFRHADFLDLAQQSASTLPQCDFVVLHGVYSWVADTIQQAIRQLLSHCLRPGGLFYVSYISHPGSASFSAAQRFFRQAAQHTQALDAAEQVAVGIAELNALAQGGAGYFIEHKSARREVEQLSQMLPAYVAHEFLNQHWQAMHSGDVIMQMRAVACDYVASANRLENVDGLSLPGQLATTFARWQQQGWTVEQLETARDLARNQNQRRDIYQKQAADFACSPAEYRSALLSQNLALSFAAPSEQAMLALHSTDTLQLSTRIGNVNLQAEAILPLLQALLAGPCSYQQLAQRAPYHANPGIINQLLQALVHMSYVEILRADFSPTDAGRLKSLQQVLQQAHQRQVLPSLYVPAARAGTAVVLPSEPSLSRADYQQRCVNLGVPL